MRYYSNANLVEVLAGASFDELLPLFQQVEIPARPSYPIHFLVKRISELGANSIANIFRTGEATGYLSILEQVERACRSRGARHDVKALIRLDDANGLEGRTKSESNNQNIQEACIELEDEILAYVAEEIYRVLTPEQKQKVNADLERIARNVLGNPCALALGAGGMLSVASLGGFGTYTLMSTLLHTASLGTLSFGAYTTASSVLSVVLGPVGWAALGAYSLFALGSPRFKKMLPVVVAVALIRRNR